MHKRVKYKMQSGNLNRVFSPRLHIELRLSDCLENLKTMIYFGLRVILTLLVSRSLLSVAVYCCQLHEMSRSSGSCESSFDNQ